MSRRCFCRGDENCFTCVDSVFTLGEKIPYGCRNYLVVAQYIRSRRGEDDYTDAGRLYDLERQPLPIGKAWAMCHGRLDFWQKRRAGAKIPTISPEEGARA